MRGADLLVSPLVKHLPFFQSTAEKKKANGTLEGSRTPNLLIRSQALYPIELRVLYSRSGKIGIKAPLSRI